MEIKVNLLSTQSLKSAIKKIKELKKLLNIINDEFARESLFWIQDRANMYLDSRVYSFPNSANVKDYWTIQYVGSNKWQLRNTNELSTLIEFGTGITGQQSPHTKSTELNYEYDVNNHGLIGWDFKFYYEGEEYSYKNYTGFKGKSFLYDAFYDYLYTGEYLTIYKNIYSKYIK